MNSKSVAVRFVTLAAAVLSATALAESFVVASGETRTLDDSTIDLYDSISVASGGVLVLDTSEAPAVAITGGGAIARSELAEMPNTVTFEISSEDIIAGKVIALSDDFDLSKVTLSVDGLFPDEMDKETRYPFVTTSGLFTGTPTVLAPGLPVGYRFAYGPKRISLIPTRGFVVICR